MRQVWRDLLFAHWPLPAQVVRGLLPRPLQLDTFDEQAWITLACFHMSVLPRGLPLWPGMSRIAELNCRTYVTLADKPGVFFFSLDAASRSAVWGARSFYHLPYFYAQMCVETSSEKISYSSRRGGAVWQATYRPTSNVRLATPGTIDHWLTERYCFYAVHKGRAYRGEIHHSPWPLQNAFADIRENTIAEAAGMALGGPASITSFTREMEVHVWAPQAVALDR